jgi:hypothetical protein
MLPLPFFRVQIVLTLCPRVRTGAPSENAVDETTLMYETPDAARALLCRGGSYDTEQ